MTDDRHLWPTCWPKPERATSCACTAESDLSYCGLVPSIPSGQSPTSPTFAALPVALPQAECYRTQSVASCKMLPGQRNAGCISSIGRRPSCELAAVLTWLNHPAARRLRRWPAARIDPGCARRRDEPWPGRKNGAQPNRETPSRSARRVTFSVRQPVTELREATRTTKFSHRVGDA